MRLRQRTAKGTARAGASGSGTNRGTAYLTAFGVAVACGVVVFGAIVLLQMRRDAWKQATLACSNLSIALARDIWHNIEVIDLSLRGADEAMHDPALSHANPYVRQRAIFGPALSAEALISVTVYDAAGRPVETTLGRASDLPNIADRDSFRLHRDNPGAGLYVSRAHTPAYAGAVPSIRFSRRRSGPNGQFEGIIVGTLQLKYFQDMFERFHLGDGGILTLEHAQGRILARYPYRASDIDKDINGTPTFETSKTAESGVGVFRSPVDTVDHIIAFRHVGDLPLVLLVGMSVDDVYRPWRHKALIIGSILITLSMATISLCLLFHREIKRRRGTETALVNANQELSVIASNDPLTCIANRRTFENRFHEEWWRTIRSKASIGVIMVDADNFKLYNDAYGHPAGDDVLTSIAQCLTMSSQRAGDLAARYGGEEFVMLLPNTGLEGATRVAERVRHGVEALNIPHTASPSQRVTVSIGVAVASPSSTDIASALLKCADDALYAAKHHGRNCVRVAESATVDEMLRLKIAS